MYQQCSVVPKTPYFRTSARVVENDVQARAIYGMLLSIVAEQMYRLTITSVVSDLRRTLPDRPIKKVKYKTKSLWCQSQPRLWDCHLLLESQPAHQSLDDSAFQAYEVPQQNCTRMIEAEIGRFGLLSAKVVLVQSLAIHQCTPIVQIQIFS